MKKITVISIIILAVSIFCSCAKQESQQNNSAQLPEQTVTEITAAEGSTTDSTTLADSSTLPATTNSITQQTKQTNTSETLAGLTDKVISSDPTTLVGIQTLPTATQPLEQTNAIETLTNTTDKVSTTASATLADSQISPAINSSSTQQQSTSSVQTTTFTSSTTQDDSLITVSVFCSCKNAVNYGIRDKKDFSEFIPEDGVIFSATVTVPKDSTAMDAIKTAALENNVEIKETRGYIRGIGGLFEKDCGGASGWMYSVNGTLPNVSSDKYTLNSNDRIELHYTVNLGDVAQIK